MKRLVHLLRELTTMLKSFFWLEIAFSSSGVMMT